MNNDQNILKLQCILRHKNNVLDNGILLGTKLLELGEVELGKELIANVYSHDNSKFFEQEWNHLWPDDPKLKDAVGIHQLNNKHHPEYWNGIKNMPRLYLAEMMCDIKARSSEFGTSVLDWLQVTAPKKYDFSLEDQVYKDCLYFINLLCDAPFKTVKTKTRKTKKVKKGKNGTS
jgi:hypothetical protein